MSDSFKDLKLSITKLRYRNYYILALVFIIIFTFLVLVPLIKIIITSLSFQANDERMVRGAREGAFTFYHYSRVFVGKLARSLFYKPFINSLIIGVGVTVLSMFLGTVLAWILVRTDIPFKKFLNTIIVIPYMMPSWVMALAWLLVFKNSRTGGTPGMLTNLFGVILPDWVSYGMFPIIICLGFHYYAYSFLLVSGALQTVNSELEEAGALSGLNKVKILKK